LADNDKTTTATAEKKGKAAAAQPAEKFPLEDLLQNCEVLFGCKPEVINGALHGNAQREFTIDEIKQLIDKFKKKRVI
jgi:hypothetical protein